MKAAATAELVMILWACFGITPCHATSDPADADAELAFRQLVSAWQHLAHGTANVLPEYYDYCWQQFASFHETGKYTDSLVHIALNDLYTPGQSAAPALALEVLSKFRTPESEAAIRKLVYDGDALEADAARALVRWGDWDTALPVLERYKMYGEIATDPRGLPILNRALASRDPFERFHIATVLANGFQDESYLLQAARDVLSALPLNDFGASRTRALDVLRNSLDPADVHIASTIVNLDTSHTFRVEAFGALVTMARNGSSDAMTQLRRISSTCPDQDVRERAAFVLQKIDSGK
jgi:hypothetical protein